MNNEVIFLFLTAHIIGDYYLQTKKMAEEKTKKFSTLLFHCLIYTAPALILIIPVFSIEYLWTVIIFSCVHLLIDFVKWIVTKVIINSKNPSKETDSKLAFKYIRTLYIADQLAHIVSIILISIFLYDYIGTSTFHLEVSKFASNFSYTEMLKVSLLFLVILKPTNVTFKRCFNIFKPKDSKEKQLNAGALIGDFERILIVILLILNQYAPIGLVFTAKSIARYNKISTEKKFSEYYLLGTLYSALSAIIAFLAIWKGFIV